MQENEPFWQKSMAFFNPEPDDEYRRLKQILGMLLVLLLILLLLFSCSSLALIGYQNIKGQDTRSKLAADYSPWGFQEFKAVHPGIIDAIEKDLIAQGLIQEGDLDADYYDGLVWWIPDDATEDEIKVILGNIILLTSQPTQVANITPTATPTLTSTPTSLPTMTPTPTNPGPTNTLPYIPPLSTATFTPIPPPPPGGTISGIVFEDVNFAGGGGTGFGGGDLLLQNVTVELYDAGNSFITSVNSDVNGAFSFVVGTNGTYIVRVVTSTIGDGDTPPNNGLNAGTPIIEQTFEHNGVSGNGGVGAMGGNVFATSDYVIGAGSVGDTNVSVTVASANVPGVQLGFSYNVITNTADGGQGSLRQYINNALAVTGASTGYFYLDPAGGPNYTFSPASAYPILADATGGIGINGTGYNVIVDGTSAGAVHGFELGANNTIANLTIQNFTNFGIQVNNSPGNSISGNTLTGNDQGVNITGASAINNTISGGNIITGNTQDGLRITNSANNNTVSGNTISFNLDDGIDIDNGGNNNTISGNTITSNTASGIDITDSATITNANTISGNTINSNVGDGILFNGALVFGNTVSGNTINSNDDGIEITNNTNNHTINGNMISSNDDDGIAIELSGNNIRILSNTMSSNGVIDPSGDGIHADGAGATLILMSQNLIWNSIDTDIALTNAANSSIAAPTITSITVTGADEVTIIGTSIAGATLEIFDVTGGGTPVYLTSLVEGVSDNDAGAGGFNFVITGLGLVSTDSVRITQTNGGTETSVFTDYTLP